MPRFIVAFAWLLISGTVHATDVYIHNLKVDITILPDGAANIVESGEIRIRNGSWYGLLGRELPATNSAGDALTYTTLAVDFPGAVSQMGLHELYSTNDNWAVRLNPKKRRMKTGNYPFKIRYQVHRPVFSSNYNTESFHWHADRWSSFTGVKGAQLTIRVPASLHGKVSSHLDGSITKRPNQPLAQQPDHSWHGWVDRYHYHHLSWPRGILAEPEFDLANQLATGVKTLIKPFINPVYALLLLIFAYLGGVTGLLRLLEKRRWRGPAPLFSAAMATTIKRGWVSRYSRIAHVLEHTANHTLHLTQHHNGHWSVRGPNPGDIINAADLRQHPAWLTHATGESETLWCQQLHQYRRSNLWLWVPTLALYAYVYGLLFSWSLNGWEGGLMFGLLCTALGLWSGLSVVTCRDLYLHRFQSVDRKWAMASTWMIPAMSLLLPWLITEGDILLLESLLTGIAGIGLVYGRWWLVYRSPKHRAALATMQQQFAQLPISTQEPSLSYAQKRAWAVALNLPSDSLIPPDNSKTTPPVYHPQLVKQLLAQQPKTPRYRKDYDGLGYAIRITSLRWWRGTDFIRVPHNRA